MKAITKQSARFAETDIDDEIVVMRLDNGDFFSMSGTAATIWRLIDGARDRAALLAAVADQFDGDEARVAADVDALLAHLRGLGLLANL